MSATPESIAILAQQYAQLEALEQVIAEEKLILQQHQPDTLLKISEKKNQLLIAIQGLDQQISINQAFSIDKKAGFLEKELVDIENLLHRCQQQNQINGQIITQSQLAVERMKTSLLEGHNKAAVTYDNKGKKTAGLSSIGLKA